MSDFVPTEELAAVSLTDSAPAPSDAPATAASTAAASAETAAAEGAVEEAEVEEQEGSTAELTKTARAILDDQNFFRENIPRAAILSLNKEYITCVIMYVHKFLASCLNCKLISLTNVSFA